MSEAAAELVDVEEVDAGMPAGAADWVEVAANGEFSCGLRATGALYCWGRNDVGQLGLGRADGEAHPMPVRIMERQ